MILFDDEYIQEAYGKEKYAEGEASGTNRMVKLFTLLVKDGRADEIVRVNTDEAYLNQLIQEYHLA